MADYEPHPKFIQIAYGQGDLFALDVAGDVWEHDDEGWTRVNDVAGSRQRPAPKPPMSLPGPGST